MDIINLVLTFILLVSSGVYTFIAYKALRSTTSPLLFLKPLLKNCPNEFNRMLMNELGLIAPDIRGISKINIDKKIQFSLINDGTRPANDIKIEYEIVTYKNEISFGIDEADVRDCRPVFYKKVTKTIGIDYLAPKDNILVDVVFVTNYPKIEVFVKGLKDNKNVFVNQKMKIYEYQNFNYIELGDSQDYRMMVGV